MQKCKIVFCWPRKWETVRNGLKTTWCAKSFRTYILYHKVFTRETFGEGDREAVTKKFGRWTSVGTAYVALGRLLLLNHLDKQQSKALKANTKADLKLTMSSSLLHRDQSLGFSYIKTYFVWSVQLQFNDGWLWGEKKEKERWNRDEGYIFTKNIMGMTMTCFVSVIKIITFPRTHFLACTKLYDCTLHAIKEGFQKGVQISGKSVIIMFTYLYWQMTGRFWDDLK